MKKDAKTLIGLFAGALVLIGAVYMVAYYHGKRENDHSQTHRISWEQLDTWAISEAFIEEQVEKINKEISSDLPACKKEIHMLLEFVRYMPGVRSYLKDNKDIKIEYREWLYDQIMSQSDTNSPNSF
jgi:hypothetical protein